MSGQTGTLGKYQIIREIARSNDIVYEAYDPVMNRRVALKELSIPSGSTGQQLDDRRSRFLREARAAGTLTHPNIVTIYEYGEESGRHYIAMEYLEGHTLRNEIDTHGFLAPARAVDIAGAILKALEYAHDHGVIHRDIKPDNVQLLPDGTVKITDFGIARLTFEPNITMDGQVFGTPSYMSPEQVVGKEIDARSDLFSVGILVYEMIAGKKPFGGDSVVSITYAIMNTTPDQPSQMNWAIWQVVERSVEKSSQLRFASAKEMRLSLENALSASTGSVIDPSPGFHVPQSNVYAPGPYSVQPNAPPPNNPYVQSQPPQLPPYPAPPSPYGSAPPSVYAYNPFGVGGGPTGVPNQSTGYPPGTYVPPPIYYPPPPRAPLIKPETKQFLGKLAVTVLVLGTFFGLIIALVTGLSAAFQRDARMRQDQVVMDRLEIAQKKPVEEAIAEYESNMARIVDPLSRAAAGKSLAVLYERRGKAYMGAKNYDGAEADFKRAIELDPANAAFPSDLGELFGKLAQQASDPNRSVDLWRFSAEHWAQAIALETHDDAQKENYQVGAAHSYVQLATIQISLGYTNDARLSLGRGLEVAPPNSHLASDIQRRLNSL